MNSVPKVSYIVSAYDRPDMLPVCLWSLKGQSDPSFEVLVTDNADNLKIQRRHRQIIASLEDKRFKYLYTGSKIAVSDCYWSAELAAKQAKGEWLCFPCDDCYYVPGFQRRMLQVAGLYKLDAVLCDCVYPYNGERYDVVPAKPGQSISAKSAFMIKRAIFPGFRTKPQGKPAPTAADSAMLLDLVHAGYRCGNAQDVMVVHN